MLKTIFLSLLVAKSAHTLTINYPDNSCDPHKAVIEEEMQFAIDMAFAASNNVEGGQYYENMFSDSIRDDTFKAAVASTFKNVGEMLQGTSQSYNLKVTCDDTKPFCKTGNYLAHMSDKLRTMNLCDRFFTMVDLSATRKRLQDCSSMTLREAHRTKAAILVHEMTHTMHSMDGRTIAKDYAYGFNACYQLARRLFDRSCEIYGGKGRGKGQAKKILCPDANGQESVCDEKLSGENADTYALVAAGIYFSDQCKRAIPLPPLPSVFQLIPTESRPAVEPERRRRRNRRKVVARWNCPNNEDYLVIDGYGEYVIEGYVAFGDSYAAGMGTGSTTWDSCRVGENNLGDLVYRSWNDPTISFEKKACSGDTTDGLSRQVNEWQNYDIANVGTISIGGNDLGFSDLVKFCIITPNTWWSGPQNRQYCLDAEKKARTILEDDGEMGMKAKLIATYMKIMSKAGRDDFQLYVMGYPAFFNFDTTDCDKTTFNYWADESYGRGDNPDDRWIYLTQDLRREIDYLVTDFNNVIEGAVNEVNRLYLRNRAHYIDTNTLFNAHRWCEQGDWHEPAPQIDTTWFFLSGWPDVSVEGWSENTAVIEDAEIASLVSAGQIALPDANCRETLDQNADPYMRNLCDWAETIALDPNGPVAQLLANANADIQSGDFTSKHISWWLPTRQIKTFHPRSPGMVAYRDAVRKRIEAAGQI